MPEEKVLRKVPRDKPWICPGCGALLGYVGKGGREIRIKYKDLYITVEGGRITRPCRKCGRLNELIDAEYVAYLKEKYGEEVEISDEMIE